MCIERRAGQHHSQFRQMPGQSLRCILNDCIQRASSRFVSAAQLNARKFGNGLHEGSPWEAQAQRNTINADLSERPNAEQELVLSLSQCHSLEYLSNDCLRCVMERLSGADLLRLSAVSSSMRRGATESSLWQHLCSRLDAFCELASIEIEVKQGKWFEWAGLYRSLSNEAFSKAMTSQLLLPSSSEMVSQGKVVRYFGEIGSDRAVRAAEGWTLPPGLNHDVNKKRLGFLARAKWSSPESSSAWAVPPLLVSSDSEEKARYVQARCRYFEVKVSDCHDSSTETSALPDEAIAPERWCIAIGVSTQGFRLEGMQPGWDRNSCAYHGDDGRVFFGNSGVASFPKFGPGDTVGCGLTFDGSLFFTKNGAMLGCVRDVTSKWCRGQASSPVVYPTVGVDSLCPIEVNWGRKPFAYGFEEVLEAEARDAAVLGLNGACIATPWRYGVAPVAGLPLDATRDGCTIS